jgi:hypothetical protein
LARLPILEPIVNHVRYPALTAVQTHRDLLALRSGGCKKPIHFFAFAGRNRVFDRGGATVKTKLTDSRNQDQGERHAPNGRQKLSENRSDSPGKFKTGQANSLFRVSSGREKA